MPRSFLALCLGLFLSLLAGCARLPGTRLVYVEPGLTALVMTAVMNPHPYCKECEEPGGPVYAGAVSYDAPPLPASPRDRVPDAPALRTFDAVRARATLAATDLERCREQGTPAGYGHAIVTYADGGFATKVVIDDPRGLTPGAVQCVGAELGRQRVAPFAGPPTDVGVTWFIR